MSMGTNEAKDSMEKLKEFNKLQYDYHKHMTTLTGGAILIIIGLLEGVFKQPKDISFIMASIIFFVISLLCSLELMTLQGDLMLYLNGIFIEKKPEKITELTEKASSISKRANIFDKGQKIFFFIGIAALIIFAFINILRKSASG